MLYKAVVIITLSLAFAGCSSRGVHDTYLGATEQRLVTHSLDQLVKELPEKDFQQLRNKKVFLKCSFLRRNDLFKYAVQRMRMGLREKYGCSLVEDPAASDVEVYIFFNAIGTNQDSLGLKTPDLVTPVAGISAIDIFVWEMYHGVSELDYYILSEDSRKPQRGERIKSVVRTDRIILPLFSVPLNRLD